MSFSSMVRIYTEEIRPRAEGELDWFQSQPSLNAAIKYAGLAINSNGKRYSHQRRIKKGVLPLVENILKSNLEAIKRCSNFDELFNLIDNLLEPVEGIGELYIYDTSLRIGAKLNLLPEKVYLHAGTRDGAKALGFDGKTKYIELFDLPVELQGLKPHEIEDILCIFKAKLKRMKFNMTGKEIHRRSWCG